MTHDHVAPGVGSHHRRATGVRGAAIADRIARKTLIEARRIRDDAAEFAFLQPHPQHLGNGDEVRYSKRIGNYSKGLPHNQLGEVEVQAYNSLLAAFGSKDPADFEKIPLTPAQNCPNNLRRKLTNPQAGLCFVGGELNKVAANIAIGRNMGGVHWRSDYTESVRLGERIAILLLQEQGEMYNEHYSFTRSSFDGRSISIS